VNKYQKQMAKKLAVKSIAKKPNKNTTYVLFPKGPSPVKGVFDIEFGALVTMPKHVIARYKIIPKDVPKYKDMVRDLQPSFGRNFSVVVGIKSMFVVPKATDCLEYAVCMDAEKAKTYFSSAVDLKLNRESVISEDFIKAILKTHIARFHKF